MRFLTGMLLLCIGDLCSAQAAASEDAARLETRTSLAVIDDATFYGRLREPLPRTLNQVLLEPSFGVRYRSKYSFSTSLVGITTTYSDNYTHLRVKEAYLGLSSGNLDLTAGRKMVRWGTGYAFTAAGILDPPRDPANPGDRLNVNEGRDMVKAEYVRGQQAFTAAWSTAALARKGLSMRDTTAFRYNVLVRGFDTALIASTERGGATEGALTFTRVLGQAWEIHGEAAWRDQAAVLAGAKYTTPGGITFIGEFYAPPNTAYFNGSSISSSAGRQHYVFFNASKVRLRERPGWKEWDVSGAIVGNLNDHSYTGVIDVSRWFGNHFSTYMHLEMPRGSRTSTYGAAPWQAATSAGIRFQL